jgi:predicted DNA-binding transcriptional regulator AlpA
MSKKTFSTGEAAAAIGVSRQTLQSWITVGHVAAPNPIEIGGMTVRPWTKADIERARKFKGTLKMGRRPKEKGQK